MKPRQVGKLEGRRREKPPLMGFIAWEMVLLFEVRSRWMWSGMTGEGVEFVGTLGAVVLQSF